MNFVIFEKNNNVIFQILLSFTVISLGFTSFSYFTRLIDFKKNYFYLSLGLLFLTVLCFLLFEKFQQEFPAFKFALILMFSFAVPILFFMRKIMDFRMKNFTESNNQNQGLQNLYTHFKKLKEYAFAFFLVMIVFYQILIIWVPKITEGINQEN
jgi:hypothetical protein